MFTPSGVFRGVDKIPCPARSECAAPNCIFSHDALAPMPASTPTSVSAPAQVSTPAPVSTSARTEPPEPLPLPPAKRQKLSRRDNDDATPFVGQLLKPAKTAHTTASVGDEQNPQTAPSSTSAGQQEMAAALPAASNALARQRLQAQSAKTTTVAAQASPQTATTPAATSKTTPVNATHEKPVAINPRKLDSPPAKHQDRHLYVTKLYDAMVKLNKQVASSPDPEIKALRLTHNQLVTLALDEEEHKATSTPAAVYVNAIKLHIVYYMRMTLDKWREDRIRDKAEGNDRQPVPVPEIPPAKSSVASLFESELTPDLELYIMRRLVVNQVGLDQHGYITSVPSAEKAKEAAQAVETSCNYEMCARCNTRFQAFPDRRTTDGAVTTGGKCTFHWGKAPLESRDVSRAVRERIYSCCYEVKGASQGCTDAPSHVYKVQEANRLHAVMPFIATPPNDQAPRNRAVVFDCEMGYTTKGTELLRLTALSCPQHEVLLDILVRPLGVILDLNTRFSGVTPDHVANAIPYKKGENGEVPQNGQLRIVQSPHVARELFLRLISPETPLIGHGLENDLIAIRLVHPTIIDTVLLYPTNAGLPIRHALKTLAHKELKRSIQVAGADGHDSKEDAIAAGDLVRVRVARKWREMKAQNWEIQDGKLTPPKFRA